MYNVITFSVYFASCSSVALGNNILNMSIGIIVYCHCPYLSCIQSFVFCMLLVSSFVFILDLILLRLRNVKYTTCIGHFVFWVLPAITISLLYLMLGSALLHLWSALFCGTYAYTSEVNFLSHNYHTFYHMLGIVWEDGNFHSIHIFYCFALAVYYYYIVFAFLLFFLSCQMPSFL